MTILTEAQRLFTDALSTPGSLLTTELFAWLVFGSYFALILASFGIVLASILDGVKWGRLIEGRAFYFVRAAVAALGCTWYCTSSCTSQLSPSRAVGRAYIIGES